MRAAIVGGGAYYAGKRVQERRQDEADQEARLEALEAEQYAAPQQSAPASPGGISDAGMAQLEKLAHLRDAGVLTEDEFNEQKRRILAAG
jgi:hypothetical protein